LDKAEGYLQTRYERLRGVLRLTWPRLLSTLDARIAVGTLRAEGWLDWRILSSVANVAMNWRAHHSRPRNLEEQIKTSLRSMQEEQPDSPEVPMGEF